MIKIFAGLKGSGKTKNLIDLVNAAQEKTSGCVVCIEKGSKLIHEINNKTRLVDISEYKVNTAEQLYGFVCGALSANFDIYIADLYYELGEKEKMYKQYDRVLRNDPENSYVLNNYAYFLSVDNIRLDEALKMSAITIEKEPNNATYLDTYAWILYKLGRYKEAKKWMGKVFSYDKNPGGINYEHYGDILYKLGETEKAIQNWKKLMRRPVLIKSVYHVPLWSVITIKMFLFYILT